MTALVGLASRKEERLRQAYETALNQVDEVIERAVTLSEQEHAALEHRGALGNVIEVSVLGNLGRLRSEWMQGAGDTD